MNHFRLVIILLVVSPLLGGQLQAKEIVQLKGKNAAFVARVVAPGECSLAATKQIANIYLKRFEGLPVVRVVITTDEDTGFDLAGKGMTDVTFSQWQSLFQKRERATREGTCAEVVKLGPRATLRFVNRTGQPKGEEVRLRGSSSVFHWRVGNMDLELLSVGFTDVSVPHKAVAVSLFAETQQAFGKSEVERIIRYFHSLLKVSDLSVGLRNDGWFLSSPEYPWVNPFDVVRGLPSWDAFHSGPEAYCAYRAQRKRLCSMDVGHVVAP